MERVLWVGIVVLGCGTSSAPTSVGAPGAADTAEVSLCPDCNACATCVAATGGETTDFGGGTDPCLDFVAYPDGGERDDDRIRALLPQVEGTFVVPMQWEVRHGEQVSGFTNPTDMTITSHVDRAWYALNSSDPELCVGNIALETTIRVQTGDGALSGEFQQFFLLQEQPWGLYVNDLGRVGVDLIEFSGTLEAEIDATRPKQGGLRVRLALIPGYGMVAGNLEAYITYADEPREAALEVFADWPSGWFAATNDTKHEFSYPQVIEQLARDAGLQPLQP